MYFPVELTVPPPVASCTDHVTAVDWPAAAPVTVAVNVTDPATVVEAGLGEIETTMAGVVVTVTVARSLFEVSATLVATTWNVPATPGAVYLPEGVTVPPAYSCTDHVTAGDWPALTPVTAAVNVTLPPGVTEIARGATATCIPAEPTGSEPAPQPVSTAKARTPRIATVRACIRFLQTQRTR